MTEACIYRRAFFILPGKKKMRISALLVVVALLACATARVAVLAAAASACDGISCGMGSCNEVPPLVPFLSNVSTYRCECNPGWLNFVALDTLTACYIPICLTDISCYHQTPKFPPLGSNVTLHPCLGMDCGEGTCVEEQGKPVQCQCNPGAANLRNDPSFPCTTNCFIGQDGCPVRNPPPSPPSPSAAPPGNDHESSGPTAPSSNKGYVRLQNMLLLVLIAALHLVW